MDSVIGHYMEFEGVDLSESACARMSKPICLLACTGAHIHPFVCTSATFSILPLPVPAS